MADKICLVIFTSDLTIGLFLLVACEDHLVPSILEYNK